MFRRILRIFAVVGLVAIVGGAVVGAVRPVVGQWGKGVIVIHGSGIAAIHFDSDTFNLDFSHDRWSPAVLLHLPAIEKSRFFAGIFVPWWLLLVLWAPLTYLIFRLTRPKRLAAAFPVEPAAEGNR